MEGDNEKVEKMEEGDDEGEEGLTCPLCHDGFKDKETLEEHAMSIHSINAEGLQRLMMLMQGSHWLNSSKNKNDEDTGKDDCILRYLSTSLFNSPFHNSLP